MLQLTSLQPTLNRWQARLFFFLQERFGVTLFMRFQEDNEVSQKKFIDSYEDIFYHIMNVDMCRMNAYTDVATNRTLCGDKTFVDIGTGMYLTLTKLLLKGGVAHVHAIEANKESYKKALEECKCMERVAQDKITLHQSLSTEITFNQRVDGIIHEIVGRIASNEGMPYVIADAQERFLVPNGLVIPKLVETLMVPIEEPSIGFVGRLMSWFGFESKPELKQGLQVIYNPTKQIRLSNVAEVVESFVCGPSAPPMREQLVQTKRISFSIDRTGNFCGFLLGCRVVTHENSPVINALDQITSWGTVFVRILETPRTLSKGTKIDVDFHVDASTITPNYFIAVSLEDSKLAEVKWSGPLN
ncbi:MAG: hypothetical protein KME29_05620 [Calothrix sp. FI2-JRJ7]|jgi:hypothetical protein|nr:hypothetical protein [Calothrix sp. FI2-JRJ7]